MKWTHVGVVTTVKEVDMTKPRKKTWAIWIEGFRITGNEAEASQLGWGDGDTWDEAVEDYMSQHPNHGIEKRGEGYCIWGCYLFDNEKDARKSFG